MRTELNPNYFYCLNPDCRKIIRRTPGTIEPSGHVFCNHHCAAMYNNPLRAKPKIQCAYSKCSNVFHLWKNEKYCCNECHRLDKRGRTKYTSISVLEQIKGFVNRANRIPFKNEMYHLYRPARRFFGTWNKAIIAAGFIPNPVRFANHYHAIDGHHCDSMSEKIVDDWLSAHHVPHEIHVLYPWHNSMTADFKVDDYWIELFGLAGQFKKYDDLRVQKLNLIKKYKLKLITIFAKEAFNEGQLMKKLSCLLKYQDSSFPKQLSVLSSKSVTL